MGDLSPNTSAYTPAKSSNEHTALRSSQFRFWNFEKFLSEVDSVRKSYFNHFFERRKLQVTAGSSASKIWATIYLRRWKVSKASTWQWFMAQTKLYDQLRRTYLWWKSTFYFKKFSRAKTFGWVESRTENFKEPHPEIEQKNFPHFCFKKTLSLLVFKPLASTS